MIDERTTTAQVEVEVDPLTAFRVFSEEMDRWWVAGPINFYDSAKAVAMRCESGIGGRLMEVYDEDTGDGLELGRITVWEPGELLAWQSTVDDVEITVRFVAVESGTRVVVEAHVPEGGEDQGGSSWVRVAPYWFSAWIARRDRQSATRSSLSRLALTVAYARP
ncbi:MAG: bleomycin resistance protein, partial [Acidimicrobiia bacterium]